MSVSIETIITCDFLGRDCEGNYARGDQRHLTAKDQRKNFRWHEKRGDTYWKHSKGKDYCYECWCEINK